jgi:hypothetical protein
MLSINSEKSFSIEIVDGRQYKGSDFQVRILFHPSGSVIQSTDMKLAIGFESSQIVSCD